MNQYYRPGGFQKFSLFPPGIKVLFILNAAFFVLELMFGPIHISSGYSLNAFFREYLYLHPLDGTYVGGQFVGNYFYPWQLITFQFLHGGFFHLFFNMFVLWMFGTELEAKWGTRKFIVYYLLCGIGSGLIQIFVSTAPTLGASGAVYGILLAFAMINPDRPLFFIFIPIPIKAKYFVMFMVGISLISGLSNNPNDNTAHFAHLGGMVAGFLMMKYGDKIGLFRFFDKAIGLFTPKQTTSSGTSYRTRTYDGATVYSVNWEEPAKKKASHDESTHSNSMNVDGEEITQAKVDEILDKISANGYQSLTEKEKKILFELSQKLK